MAGVATLLAALALAVSARPAAAQLGAYYYWSTFPNPDFAQDGGIGVVAPSASPLNPWLFTYDAGLYRWDGSAWRVVPGPPGNPMRMAIDTTGQPWVVTWGNVIYRRLTTGKWQAMPGSAWDISAGADGSVWIEGAGATDSIDGGGRIYRWSGTDWQAIQGGGGVGVAAGPDGSVWVIKGDNSIWHVTFSGPFTAWQRLPGAATDIAVASDGTVWVIGTNRVDASGNGIYKWTGSAWASISGSGCFIAIGGRSDAPIVTTCTVNGSAWVKQRLWRSY
jgi:hypothetical protein